MQLMKKHFIYTLASLVALVLLLWWLVFGFGRAIVARVKLSPQKKPTAC